MKYKIKTDGPVTHVNLSDNIGAEAADVLFALRSEISTSEVVFDCSAVAALNSIGISNWIAFLNDTKGQFQSRFVRCPQVLVDAAVMIPNFFGDGRVESVNFDITCEKCDKRNQKLVNVADLKGLDDFPDMQCEKCGEPIAPEDDFEEFAQIIPQD